MTALFFLAVIAQVPAALADQRQRCAESLSYLGDKSSPAYIESFNACVTDLVTKEARMGAHERRLDDEAARLASEVAERRRLREEQEQQAEALATKQRTEFSAMVDRFRSDKVTQQIVQTLSLCDANARRANALIEIAKERRYSRRAGVVDLRSLQDQKDALRDADDSAAAAKRELRHFGVKPLSCSNRSVGLLEICVNDDGQGDGCTTEQMRSAVVLYQATD